MSTVSGGQGWWQASDGFWYPPETAATAGAPGFQGESFSSGPGTSQATYAAPPGGAEPTLVTIGDIAVTQSSVITPSGTRPIGQVSWTFTDMSRTTQSIPPWAIVCAVIGALLCLIGLLFLLVKETHTEGHVQVTVQGQSFVHTAQIPVSSPGQVADINARVGYARSLTAAAQ